MRPDPPSSLFLTLRRLFAKRDEDRPLTPAVRAQLTRDLNDEDPWSLESNPYERHRYEVMLDLLGRPYSRALEIGCAAGVFTAALAQRCTTLHVVDAIPQAIDHCRKRLGDLPNVYYSLADIGTWPGFGETYELIVVGEVLYYLGSRQHIRSAVRKISSWVQIGGTLIFSSLVDAAAARSSLIGAETTMREWKRYLDEETRYSCQGQPDEQSLVVKYRRTS